MKKIMMILSILFLASCKVTDMDIRKLGFTPVVRFTKNGKVTEGYYFIKDSLGNVSKMLYINFKKQKAEIK